MNQKSESKYTDIRVKIRAYPDVDIHIFFGARSNGKTYSGLSYCLDKFVEDGSRFVYVRRLAEAIRMPLMRQLFAGNEATGDVANHLAPLGYNGISYYSGAFWPNIVTEKGKIVRANFPMGYCQSISTWETSKGPNFPEVKTILLDEFLTRGAYLPNEPVLFMNLMSSIIRDRDDVKVILIGNTVSWSSPYFTEFGLAHVRDMKPGDSQVYSTGDGKGKIAVHFTDALKENKAEKYFAFDNPHSNMILTGQWETAEYPRLPVDNHKWETGIPVYVQSHEGFQLKLQPAVTPDGLEVILVYRISYPILTPHYPYVLNGYENAVIYSDFPVPLYNVRFMLSKHKDDMSKFIADCLNTGRVFYQSNSVGEDLRNYLRNSAQFTPLAR